MQTRNLRQQQEALNSLLRTEALRRGKSLGSHTSWDGLWFSFRVKCWHTNVKKCLHSGEKRRRRASRSVTQAYCQRYNLRGWQKKNVHPVFLNSQHRKYTFTFCSQRDAPEVKWFSCQSLRCRSVKLSSPLGAGLPQLIMIVLIKVCV